MLCILKVFVICISWKGIYVEHFSNAFTVLLGFFLVESLPISSTILMTGISLIDCLLFNLYFPLSILSIKLLIKVQKSMFSSYSAGYIFIPHLLSHKMQKAFNFTKFY